MPPANIIGGTTAGAANVIAGNTDGVYLSGSGATGNLIEGNFIGTNSGGADQLGNSGDGVAIDGDASNNTIGGTASGAANIIAYNGGAGVDVLSGVGNSILSNSISSNAGTGIVLVGTANDAPGRPDDRVGHAPDHVDAGLGDDLTSAASTTFLIQVFSNTSADAAGSFEGQTLVGSTTVTTDGGGYANFGLSLSGSIPIGAAITATATNLTTGDTSAFSGDAVNAPLIAFSATQYYVSEPASSAIITVTRNTGAGSSTVVYAAGPGTAIAGVDFTPVTAALTFAPGQTSATFSVPIIATQGRLGKFTVDLMLSNPTGAGLGSPGSAVLTITSSPGTLQFSTAAVTVPESGGGVTITVNRVGGASGTVGVSYATAAVNAIPGVDYLAVSGTLTLPARGDPGDVHAPDPGQQPEPERRDDRGRPERPDRRRRAERADDRDRDDRQAADRDGRAARGRRQGHHVGHALVQQAAESGPGGEPGELRLLRVLGQCERDLHRRREHHAAGGRRVQPREPEPDARPVVGAAAQSSLRDHGRRQHQPRAGQRALRRLRRAARGFQRRPRHAL